ncbi:hypothetical protein PRECH8_24880 [Insulibacter thermoxylanivorax]|uniref:SLH domain-containing protein n=1 Tax=Insulibacter thermoxylanivorax TaxID=2749268 RepID=A0A916QIQ4_9BACL|nr:S-layer homology domain-containing protein [Insulibacter thermoxylanivorax]GFR39192.1 hypothetical protein PRECH8_24880 [Insulibacter thermoxylanivorax]
MKRNMANTDQTKSWGSVWKRMGIVLLAALMVLSLVPPAGVLAAASISINNIYTAKDNELDEKAVTQVSVNTITLTAYITGINPDQYSNLFYEITNVDSGVTRTVKTAGPAVSDDGHMVTFSEVELTEGLNRIVVKLDGTSVISSVPGWVFFAPTVRIEEFKVDGVHWDEDKIYPDNPAMSTIIDITANVYNARNVSVYKYGDAQEVRLYPYMNQFNLYADMRGGWANADIALNPGDNILTFNASNYTYSYQIEKNLIYDNGDPFAFGVKIKETGDKLIKNPSIDTDDLTNGNKITLVGKLKVDLEGILPKYTKVDVVINGDTQQTHTLNWDSTDLSDPDPELSKPGRYEVRGFELEVDVTGGGVYTVDFVFHGETNVTQSNLMFTYYDLDQPYVKYLARAVDESDTTGTIISDTGVTNITKQPTIFYIYADDKTDGVAVYLNEIKAANRVHITNEVIEEISSENGNLRKFKYEMQNVLNGVHTLIVVPIKEGIEFNFGKKSYNIHVSSVPYVVPDNFYNGKVVNSLTAFQCTTENNQYCLEGQIVNIPNIGDFNPGDPAKRYVEVFLNNVNITSWLTVDNEGFFKLAISNEESAVNKLQEGSNILSFRLYTEQNGALRLLTTATYEIFLFSSNAPSIVKIGVKDDDDNPKFRLGTGSTGIHYFTTENSVQFIGETANITDIKLNVYRTKENGESEQWYDHFAQVGNAFERQADSNQSLFNASRVSGTGFETTSIQLSARGDTIFEFIVTNSTGILVVQTVTITKETVPYEIIYPRTYTNEKGLPQANINSNYVEIEIRAEYADAVIYDGQPAKRRSNNRNDKGYHNFYFEVQDLRSGRAQQIKFTVVRGEESIPGTIVINYVSQPIVGAKFKSELKNRIKVFEDMIDLRFQRNTSFQRQEPLYDNETKTSNQYLSDDRQIVFGIADTNTGIIDQDKESDDYLGGLVRLRNRDSNFQPVSPLFWIDVGTIEPVTDLKEALTGSGRLPYEGKYFYLRNAQEVVVPTKRAELTFKYDPAIVREAWRYVTVFQYDIYEDSDGITVAGWRNIGGVVNPKNNTITVNVDRFGFFQVMYMTQSFEDVVSHDWAKNDIETLYSKGIMGARNNSRLFRPSEAITRGEFVTMLVKIFDLPLNYKGTLTFVDATNNRDSDGLWDYRYIETAARAGIIRGTGRLGEFGTRQTLTREQAAVMIARAANLKLDSNQNKVLANLQKLFTDANAIDYYSQASVLAVTNKGIITGKQHATREGEKPTYYFDPKATFTRAEAAAVAMRILDMLGKVPR